MAYSSWTSDLKTRSSVGFLGKVVNLLVQCKERLDRFDQVAYRAEVLTSAGAINPKYPVTIFNSLAGAMAMTIADGENTGESKKLSLMFDGGDVTITCSSGKKFLTPSGASTTTITFAEANDWLEMAWTSNNQWMVYIHNGAAFS